MKKIRVLFAAIWIFWQFAFPAVSVMAQMSQFRDEVQGSAGGGGPILDTSESSISMPRAGLPGRPVESTRIGKPPPIPLYEKAEAVSPLDTRVTVRVKNAPLSTFLDIISGQAKINFIVAETVQAKKVTAFLRKVTVREALQILLQIKGLTYQRIGRSNSYLITKRSVAGPNIVTKIYTLSYISLLPITSATEEMKAITAQDVSSGMEYTQGAQGKAGAAEGISILNVIRSVQTKKYGKLATEPRTNSLIVTDIPEVFPQVEQILAELDIKAPQVLIEAQIVEINSDRVNELGIEWGGPRGEIAFFAGPARLTDYGLRANFLSGDSWKNFFPTGIMGGAVSENEAPTEIDPISSTQLSGPKGMYYGIFSLAQLQAILRALVSRSEARYLGKPKVVTLNNKTAIIQITRDAAVGVVSTIGSSESGGLSSESVERRRIGLMLKVTPQVNKEGYITLFVQPSYSDVVPSGITLQGASVLDPVSRGVSTMVRVKNGQTVVLGGMLASTDQKLVKKVPLLGYIPIIGWLFTSVSSRRINTDLVIFITPTILVD